MEGVVVSLQSHQSHSVCRVLQTVQCLSNTINDRDIKLGTKISPCEHTGALFCPVIMVLSLYLMALCSQQKQDPQAGFSIESLSVCTLDLIEAGTETAATTLRWSLVFLMNYPEVQG